jgi:hypothetical protein
VYALEPNFMKISVKHSGVHQIAKQHTEILALIGCLQHQASQQIQAGVNKETGACQTTPKVGPR